MTITTTSETIEILLAGNVATTQATFSSSFNEISSTSIVPSGLNGTTNNTTPVTIMGSPSSGNQRQLREFILENNDTAAITLTVRYNNTSVTRTIFYCVLQVGESLIFNMESGWVIYSSIGERREDGIHIIANGNIRLAELTFLPSIAGTTTIASTNIPGIHLGKAEKAYTSVSISYNVTIQAASITWCELAIYRVGQPMGVGTQQEHQRLGFTDTSGIWNSTGRKSTSVTLTGCKEGDDLYVMFGLVATTSATFRSGNTPDPLSSIKRIINTTGGNTWRPSTTEQYIATAFSNSIAGILVAWQGT